MKQLTGKKTKTKAQATKLVVIVLAQIFLFSNQSLMALAPWTQAALVGTASGGQSADNDQGAQSMGLKHRMMQREGREEDTGHGLQQTLVEKVEQALTEEFNNDNPIHQNKTLLLTLLGEEMNIDTILEFLGKKQENESEKKTMLREMLGFIKSRNKLLQQIINNNDNIQRIEFLYNLNIKFKEDFGPYNISLIDGLSFWVRSILEKYFDKMFKKYEKSSSDKKILEQTKQITDILLSIRHNDAFVKKFFDNYLFQGVASDKRKVRDHRSIGDKRSGYSVAPGLYGLNHVVEQVAIGESRIEKTAKYNLMLACRETLLPHFLDFLAQGQTRDDTPEDKRKEFSKVVLTELKRDSNVNGRIRELAFYNGEEIASYVKNLFSNKDIEKIINFIKEDFLFDRSKDLYQNLCEYSYAGAASLDRDTAIEIFSEFPKNDLGKKDTLIGIVYDLWWKANNQPTGEKTKNLCEYAKENIENPLEFLKQREHEHKTKRLQGLKRHWTFFKNRIRSEEDHRDTMIELIKKFKVDYYYKENLLEHSGFDKDPEFFAALKAQIMHLIKNKNSQRYYDERMKPLMLAFGQCAQAADNGKTKKYIKEIFNDFFNLSYPKGVKTDSTKKMEEEEEDEGEEASDDEDEGTATSNFCMDLLFHLFGSKPFYLGARKQVLEQVKTFKLVKKNAVLQQVIDDMVNHCPNKEENKTNIDIFFNRINSDKKLKTLIQDPRLRKKAEKQGNGSVTVGGTKLLQELILKDCEKKMPIIDNEEIFKALVYRRLGKKTVNLKQLVDWLLSEAFEKIVSSKKDKYIVLANQIKIFLQEEKKINRSKDLSKVVETMDACNQQCKKILRIEGSPLAKEQYFSLVKGLKEDHIQTLNEHFLETQEDIKKQITKSALVSMLLEIGDASSVKLIIDDFLFAKLKSASSGSLTDISGVPDNEPMSIFFDTKEGVLYNFLKANKQSLFPYFYEYSFRGGLYRKFYQIAVGEGLSCQIYSENVLYGSQDVTNYAQLLFSNPDKKEIIRILNIVDSSPQVLDQVDIFNKDNITLLNTSTLIEILCSLKQESKIQQLVELWKFEGSKDLYDICCAGLLELKFLEQEEFNENFPKIKSKIERRLKSYVDYLTKHGNYTDQHFADDIIAPLSEKEDISFEKKKKVFYVVSQKVSSSIIFKALKEKLERACVSRNGSSGDEKTVKDIIRMAGLCKTKSGKKSSIKQIFDVLFEKSYPDGIKKKKGRYDENNAEAMAVLEGVFEIKKGADSNFCLDLLFYLFDENSYQTEQKDIIRRFQYYLKNTYKGKVEKILEAIFTSWMQAEYNQKDKIRIVHFLRGVAENKNFKILKFEEVMGLFNKVIY